MTTIFFPHVLFVLATWVSLVASQQCASFSSIPACAQDCITNAATSHTSCSAMDWSCQCTANNHQTIQDEAENCCIAACGEALTMETVRPAADSFCLAINAGEICSTTSSSTTTSISSSTISTSSATTPTTATTGTGTSTATSSVTGTATSSPTSSSTAGAAVVGSVGSLGMMLLGALAIF